MVTMHKTLFREPYEEGKVSQEREKHTTQEEEGD